VWQGVMDVWGVGTRSLPYTLCNCCGGRDT
jgi:hypothetical protein